MPPKPVEVIAEIGLSPRRVFRHSAESRAKMSAAAKARPRMAWTDGYAKDQRYRKAPHGKCKAALDRYRASPKGQRRMADYSRKRAYGLAPSEFDALVVASLGRCQLCLNQSEPIGPRELVVDHCHRTGVVRGLICAACNTMVGYVERCGLGVEWLARVERYVGVGLCARS